MAEGLRGEAGVPDRLLEQGAQGVAELMGVEGGDGQLSGDPAADVSSPVGGEPVVRTAPGGGLEADEEGGGGVVPRAPR